MKGLQILYRCDTPTPKGLKMIFETAIEPHLVKRHISSMFHDSLRLYAHFIQNSHPPNIPAENRNKFFKKLPNLHISDENWPYLTKT